MDYSYPFAVRTEEKDWLFFAASREERQIWVHELGNLSGSSGTSPINRADEEAAVRDSVMDKIDPLEAFNAWNLSMVCGPQKLNIKEKNQVAASSDE